jgi:hypothetical protein
MGFYVFAPILSFVLVSSFSSVTEWVLWSLHIQTEPRKRCGTRRMRGSVHRKTLNNAGKAAQKNRSIHAYS